jgi:hypothetical protein
MTDDELRAAYASAMTSPRSPDRASCPTPDALIALVRREGSEATRLATLDHAMTCADCQREFELLRAIDAGERRATNSGASPRVFSWHRPLALAIAASLLVAIGLGPGRSWFGNDEDTMRGDSAELTVVAPAASATVSRDSLDFVWRSVPGAAGYTVEVLTRDGAVRLSAPTNDTTMSLREPRADLPAGEYRWWVRARLPGGERRSEPRAITLRPD